MRRARAVRPGPARARRRRPAPRGGVTSACGDPRLPGGGVLASVVVSRNTAAAGIYAAVAEAAALRDRTAARPDGEAAALRSIILVGMPGSGKSSIGRRLAARLGRPFLDADTEIEAAAGLPITEIFSRYGEAHFRDGERRVIARLVSGPPVVLATGGGAFADAGTRAALRRAGAVTIWLKCSHATLIRRVVGRGHRPMFLGTDPAAVLDRLMAARHPLYAEADIVVHCTDESPDSTTRRVAEAIAGWSPPARLPVALEGRSYDVVVGEGLLARAGPL